MLRLTFIIVALVLTNLPECFPQSRVRADSLRLKHLTAARYDSVLYYSNEIAALVRGTLGESNLEYAAALNNLAGSYFFLGSYKRSEYFILQEIALRESLKAVDDISYLRALENASVICRKSGYYDEALEQVKKAEKKSLKIFGTTHPGYARTLALYGGVCYDIGSSVNDIVYLKESLRYYDKAEKINRNNPGTEYNLILNRSDKAAYYNDFGNLPLSETLFSEVVSFTTKEPGTTGTEAAALNNLGVFYFNTGNYKLSEKTLIEAIGVTLNGKQEPGVTAAASMSNLAVLYNSIGNYNTSLKLLMDATQIFENNFRRNSPSYAVLLNNTATVYMTKEYYSDPQNKSPEDLEKAGVYIRKADSIFSMNCRNPHPDASIIKSNLAVWNYLNGDKLKCAQMLYDVSYETNMSLRTYSMMNKMAVSAPVIFIEEQRNNPLIEPVMVPAAMDCIFRLSSEASLMTTAGSNKISDAMANGMAQIMFGQANNLKRDVGEYHPSYISALRALIEIYSIFNNEKFEEDLILKLINSITYRLLQDFTFLSESEKEMHYQAYLRDLNSFMSYILNRKEKNPSLTGNAYNSVLLNKGLMLKSSTAMRVAILAANDSELLELYDKWISLKKEISVLYATPVEFRSKDISVVENEANELERILVGKSQDFSDYRNGLKITWEDVKNNLKQGEAAIEFTNFRNRAKDGGNEMVYCALVMRAESKYPDMIRLCTEKELLEVISTDLNNATTINKIYGTSTRPDERLYNLLWKPIEPFMDGVKNIYISPAGLLNKVSFPSICRNLNSYLCDSYNICLNSSTGNLVSERMREEQSTSALIFGGIQYGNSGTGLPVWNYLEGTKNEGDTVLRILNKNDFQVKYITDESATETFFKQNAGRYDIIHIATHGFFFDDPDKLRFEENKDAKYDDISFRGFSGTVGTRSFVNNENPLMRSGLVFAGANEVWSGTEPAGRDDGVLTAQEVTQVDLRSNNLVVLSACETGLGDIRGNEGVYGLQRSLRMAGVKDIIMSLWEIPDYETVVFMGKFYRYFISGENIRQAFNRAQHEMRLKYDPFYWGGFVLME